MGLPSVFETGRTGMVANKAAIATTGHNIANANTEGFSRQRIQTEPNTPRPSMGSHNIVGTGAVVSRVERINDEYLEKQIRNATRDLSHFEEKDIILRQTEDIFNEMNGDGLNRLVSRFFNEFRKLSNEPDNEAIRQSVREASQSMVNDFHRIRKEVDEVRRHIDARLEGYTSEINQQAEELRNLNIEINKMELSGASANDLQDKRDKVMKKLGSYMTIDMHKDKNGQVIADIRGVGPLVVGPEHEKFSVMRSPADDQGKIENALDLKTSASAQSVVTHQIKGGKLGALVEVRDQTLSAILSRLDDLAFSLSESVNQVHTQGYSRTGAKGIAYFEKPLTKDRAAEFIELSDAVKSNVNNIATAAIPDAPGDNRVALAISAIQNAQIMNEGHATMDDWYNSIVSDVGVTSSKNRNGIHQQQDMMTQLSKMRDQVSGVSIDEETANLMQFQHAFDASAKVIQIADECLKTVLELRR